MIGNSPKSSQVLVLYIKGRKSGGYPLIPATKTANPFKFRRAGVNVLSDIFIQDSGVGRVALAFEELKVKPGTE